MIYLRAAGFSLIVFLAVLSGVTFGLLGDVGTLSVWLGVAGGLVAAGVSFYIQAFETPRFDRKRG